MNGAMVTWWGSALLTPDLFRGGTLDKPHLDPACLTPTSWGGAFVRSEW